MKRIRLARSLGSVVVGLLVAAATTAEAAEIVRTGEQRCTIRLRGPIAAGDAERLAVARSNEEPETLCLDSSGGSFGEAHAIVQKLVGQISHVRTHVEAGAICAGPCALVFMTGREALDGHGLNTPARTLAVGGKLRFETLPFETATADPAWASQSYAEAIRAIAQIMDANLVPYGFPEHRPFPRALLADILLLAPGKSLPLETVAQADAWGITLTGLKRRPVVLTTHVLWQACEYIGRRFDAHFQKPTNPRRVPIPASDTLRVTFADTVRGSNRSCLVDLSYSHDEGVVYEIEIRSKLPVERANDPRPEVVSQRQLDQEAQNSNRSRFAGEWMRLVLPPSDLISDLPH
ncbi:MAG: hypothetical protein R3D27_09970 [Hyphomicrobiaceae bacterium]